MPTKAKTSTKKTTKKAVKATKNKVNSRKGREGALGRPAVKKKTTAKKPAAKAKPKKAAAMKKPVKDLVYASDQESFWVTSGEVLNSLMALRDAFAEMESAVFKYHAEGDSNDFALWVEGVLCDGDCAADLKKAKTAKGAKSAVVKHLKTYSV